METFKDKNRALQEIARELMVLRRHNQQFKEGDSQETLLMFAEACVTLLALEHFIRIVLGADSKDKNGKGLTLANMLQRAQKKQLIKIPFDDPQQGIKKIADVRNAIIHGNFEQAARQEGCSSVEEFFKTKFASTVEAMFFITNDLMKQIDLTTGKPKKQPAAPMQGRSGGRKRKKAKP